MDERDYVTKDYTVHYRRREDSPILPKLFGLGILAYVVTLVITIANSAN